MMFLQIVVAVVVSVFLLYHFYFKRRKLPPGPTPWPIIGNLFVLKQNAPYDVLIGWRRKYGGVFTYWYGEMPVVNVVDYVLIQETFVRDGDAYADRVKFSAVTRMYRGGSYGVVFTDGEAWREQRRFTLAVLRDFGMGKNLMQEKILNEISYLLKTLTSLNIKNSHSIGGHLDLCVGSIISSVLFGFRYDESRVSDFHMLRSNVAEQLQLFGNPFSALLSWKLNVFKRLPVFADIYRRMVFIRESIFGYIDARVAEHEVAVDLAQWTVDYQPTDFVEAYLHEIKKLQLAGDTVETSFSMAQLRNVVLDLIITGQDTTSLTLGWAVLFILHKPEVQRRIHEEIDGLITTANGRFIVTEDRPNMPYMCAVINEVQRMTNLLPENLLHQTTREVTIGGYRIPKGTAIVPQISCVLFDETHFPNAMDFQPERFLDADGRLRRCEQLIPFSIGKRSCIGENLARMELFLILANIYKYFEITPEDESNLPSTEKCKGLTVHYHPYKCWLRPRKPLEI